MQFSKGKSLLMQKLYKGEVFGLHPILFDSQPPMELVSDGCECVLILKEFFIGNSSLDYLKQLYETLLPLPNISYLKACYESNLQTSKTTEKPFLEETLVMPQLIGGF